MRAQNLGSHVPKSWPHAPPATKSRSTLWQQMHEYDTIMNVLQSSVCRAHICGTQMTGTWMAVVSDCDTCTVKQKTIETSAGLTSGDLNFIFALAIFFRPTAKSQRAHERAFVFGSGADFDCILHYVSNRIRSRGSPGSPLAPEGRKSTEESGDGFIF